MEPEGEGSVSLDCDCGKPGTIRCADVADALQLPHTRCPKWICAHGGEWSECGLHRHLDGTMGYLGQAEMSADFERFVPTGDGLGFFLDKFRCWYRNNWLSAKKQAQIVLDEDVIRMVPPPSPFPRFILHHKPSGRVFRSVGGVMVEDILAPFREAMKKP